MTELMLMTDSDADNNSLVTKSPPDLDLSHLRC
jgi:hypothetical protein